MKASALIIALLLISSAIAAPATPGTPDWDGFAGTVDIDFANAGDLTITPANPITGLESVPLDDVITKTAFTPAIPFTITFWTLHNENIPDIDTAIFDITVTGGNSIFSIARAVSGTQWTISDGSNSYIFTDSDISSDAFATDLFWKISYDDTDGF